MTTATSPATFPTTQSSPPDDGALAQVLREGYGPGAWHGPDLAAALADVTTENAFLRPAPGRHNVAEIALHHAFCVRSVMAQLSGQAPEPFPLAGEDWFPVEPGTGPAWEEVRSLLDGYQRRLAEVVDDLGSGKLGPALSRSERLGLVLGITCHAVYHAGQVQLVKRLLAG